MNYKELYDNDHETTSIVESINCFEDLKNNWILNKYNNNNKTIIERRNEKIKNIYHSNLYVDGRGLELAFGLFTSCYWLLNKYDNITLDGIDFNDNLSKLIPFIKEEYKNKIDDFWIGDMQRINKPNNHYDFINSCSVWEHLPDKVYWNTLKECYRILKPGGFIGVYVDQTKNEQHIRVVPPSTTKTEMESIGFKAYNNYLYYKE